MNSKEELEIAKIEASQCKECCRNITEEEYKKYNGLCKKCYDLNQEDNSEENTSENYSNRKYNKTAILIKSIAIIGLIIGLCIGFSRIEEYKEELGAIYIITSIISGIFIYALGEIIQLLEDIKNK